MGVKKLYTVTLSGAYKNYYVEATSFDNAAKKLTAYLRKEDEAKQKVVDDSSGHNGNGLNAVNLNRVIEEKKVVIGKVELVAEFIIK